MSDDAAWIAAWLDAVKAGKATMSQRSVRSIERHGGLPRLIEAAEARGIHLVQLTDDSGRQLVAASREDFRRLC